MKKKHKIILVAVLVIIVSLIMREMGIIDVNLYKSQSKATHTQTMARRGNTSGSFTVVINWKRSEHEADGANENVISVNLSKFEVAGSTWLPFYKNAKASYAFDYGTPGGNIGGDLKGKVAMRVSGLCSHKKLVELIKKKVEKQINQYFQQQLKAK